MSELYYEKLFESLCLHDLNAVAKTAYELMGMPIVLSDANFIVKAKYPNEPLGDEQWDENTIGSPIALRFIKTFTEDAHFERHAQANKPILIDWGHYKETPRLTAAIKKRNENIGYFSALTTGHQVRDEHYRMADVIAKAFAIALGDSTVAQADAGSISLYALVGGAAVTKQDFAALPYSFAELLPPPYVLIRANMKNTFDLPVESYLGRQMSNLFSPCIETVYDCSIYLLVGNVGADYRNDPVFHSAQHAFKDMKAACGFSIPFESIAQIQDAKWQADHALQVGLATHSDQHTFHFADHVASILMDSMLANVRPNAIEAPYLKTLRALDAQEGTEYMKTLRALAENRFLKKEAAEQLSVHRNTLLYRLGRIEEITGVSLEDRSLQQYLSLYFSLMEYNRIITPALRGKASSQKA